MTKIRPYITEKSVKLAQANVYTLLVDYDATKGRVEQLVIENFAVKPLEINLVKTKYRSAKKMRKNFLDRGMKKALVKLAKEQTIPGFEIAEPTKDKKAKPAKSAKETSAKKSKGDE